MCRNPFQLILTLVVVLSLSAIGQAETVKADADAKKMAARGVEFLVKNPKGNSGVYLQNRYEIQVLDGDSTKHGMGAIINESESPYFAYNGVGEWNAYDVCFRAARFQDGKLTEKAMATVYFNGKKVHVNQIINQVWGGPNSGLDGGNDKGNGITDRPGGLKLQAEGHEVLYRNIWVEELDLTEADTDIL